MGEHESSRDIKSCKTLLKRLTCFRKPSFQSAQNVHDIKVALTFKGIHGKMHLHEMPYFQRILDKWGVTVLMVFLNQWIQIICWTIYRMHTIVMTWASDWESLWISQLQLLFRIYQRTFISRPQVKQPAGQSPLGVTLQAHCWENGHINPARLHGKGEVPQTRAGHSSTQFKQGGDATNAHW